MASTSLSTLAIIAAIAVAAPLGAELLRRFRVPGAVLELLAGIIVGPHVLAWAKPDPIILSLSDLGLAFLMFLAGFEIDFRLIRGRPLRLATVGWVLSLVIAFAVGGLLVGRHLALSPLLIALALTSTAMGTLMPMLRDGGVVGTRLGTYTLAVCTVGEFGPVLAVALLLSSDSPLKVSVLLMVFVVVAAGAALVASRPKPPRFIELLRRNLETSAQLPVRISVLFIVILVWLATELGFDVLLGAFTAGVVVRLASGGPETDVVRGKLEAIGFGFLVPIFFVVSGMNFDVTALLGDRSALLRLPMFLGLLFVARGLPALVLYRHDLPREDRVPLALFSSTALPIVVVITQIGLKTGRVLPVNAAALLGAAMASVMIFPLLAFRAVRRAHPDAPVEVAGGRLEREP